MNVVRYLLGRAVEHFFFSHVLTLSAHGQTASVYRSTNPRSLETNEYRVADFPTCDSPCGKRVLLVWKWAQVQALP